jgi:hypothetical protein
VPPIIEVLLDECEPLHAAAGLEVVDAELRVGGRLDHCHAVELDRVFGVEHSVKSWHNPESTWGPVIDGRPRGRFLGAFRGCSGCSQDNRSPDYETGG